MLLTKEVEVKIGGLNKQYYIDKGYDVPIVKKIIYKKNGHISQTRYTTPRGTKIIVKIEDLLDSCEEPIYYQCDNCNGIFHTTIHWIRNRTYDDGKLYCTKCACKIYNSGENCYLYNHNKTDEERILSRNSRQDYEWKLGVLQRDNYTCFKCGKNKSNVVAHHLDGYNWCKEKRYDITNGVCLCQQCHSEFHNIYGYGDNTQQQFEEWLNKTIDNNMLKYYNNVSYRQYYCLEDNEILFNLSYLTKIGKIKSPSKIRECCKNYNKTYHGKHYVFYEDYLKMTQEQINNIINNTHKRTRQVVCIELNLLFDTIKDAGEYVNTLPSCITACCKHRKNTIRGYHWLYIEDYKQDISKLRKVDINEINRTRNTNVNSKT